MLGECVPDGGMAGPKERELMELGDVIPVSLVSGLSGQSLALQRASITGHFQPGYLNIPLSLFVAEMTQSWGPQDPNQEAAEIPEEEKGLYATLW